MVHDRRCPVHDAEEPAADARRARTRPRRRLGRLTLLGTGLACLLAEPAAAQPGSGQVDRLGPQLAQVRTFARGAGDRLWPGYGAAPFGFLLVDGQSETLICRDPAPAGFDAAGAEPATGCAAYRRKRSGLPEGLLAAMPLFGPPSTIVMGSPAATGRPLPAWLRTILHEHFHQWQAALPDYYKRVGALDLAGGDETGMWMLNYPFPYADARTGTAYDSASRALSQALAARGTPAFLGAYDRYLAARKIFADASGERNWRYIELQLWQEGVARWTEIMLGLAYPDPEVRASAARLQAATLAALLKPDLQAQGRELAYPFGAGEAMLLEYCGPEWRQGYERILALGPLLAAARKRCGRLMRGG